MNNLESLQNKIDKIKQLYNSKNYKECLDLSKEFLKIMENEYVLQICSNIYFLENNFIESLNYTNKTIEINKNLSNYMNKLKILNKLQDKNLNDEVKIIIKEIINLDSDGKYFNEIIEIYIDKCNTQIEAYDFLHTLVNRITKNDYKKYYIYILFKFNLEDLDNITMQILQKELKLKESDFNDETIINNINNITSKEDCILLINYLTKPKILANSENITEFYNRSINNLDKLIEIFKNKVIYENVDIFSKYFLNNYFYYYTYYGFNLKNFYIKVSSLLKNICPDLEYISPKLSNNNKQINSRIKIAFISNLIFENHSVCKDRIGIIKSLLLDNRFDVYLITNKNYEGEIFKFVIKDIKNINKIFIPKNISNSRKIIENLNLDIIIYPEIGMDIFFYILAHSRLAPIQVNTWGHSETSGISTIDYYFSSKYFENSLSQENYSEKLILLDSLSTYYYDFKIYNFLSKEFNREENLLKFNLPSNLNIYGILQNIIKLHPIILETVKNILINDKFSIFVFICNQSFKNKFFKFLEENLGYLTNRIRIYDNQNLYDYFKLISCMDIIIDSYPFGGCNTTLDSFYLNKIVVTTPTNKLNGSFTTGFYKKMDIYDPIAYDIKNLADKAIWFMTNKEDKKIIENKIKENKSKLFQEEESIYTWKYKLIELYYSHNLQ